MRILGVSLMLVVLAGCGSAGNGGEPAVTTSGSSGGAGTDGGFQPPPGCEGVALTTDGSLSFDVRSIAVEGAVTMTGALTGPVTRGDVEFTSTTGSTVARAQTDASGRYRVALTPDRYRVTVLPASTRCDQPAQLCTAAAVLADVALTADGSLDLQVPVARVQLGVTVNGAPFPDTGRRGQLWLTAGPNSATLAVNDGTVRTLLVARGRYQVRWEGTPGFCGGDSSVPCGSGVVVEDLALTADGAVTVDVRSVRVSGTLKGLTRSGERAMAGRSVTFTADQASCTAQSSGNGTYAQVLVPGRYDAIVDGECGDAFWPCNDHRAQQGITLTADGSLDLVVPSIAVSGTVSATGSASVGGQLMFVGESGTATTVVTGGNYSTRLAPGRYDVSWAPGGGGCPTSGPCNSQPVHQGVTLTADGVLDVQLQQVNVTLQVTHSGSAVPLSGAASVTLVGRDGQGSVRWPASGETRAVAPGRYDVVYALSDCAAAPSLPCGTMAVARNVVLTADGALEASLSSVDVHYALTLNGGAFPANGAASLTWASLGDGDVGPTLESVRPDGTVRILAGQYVVAYTPGAACEALTAVGLPCTAQVLIGCD